MAGSNESAITNFKEIHNRNYKNDINYNTELNRWFLKPIGIWPRSPETTWGEVLITRTLNIIHSALIGFLLIGLLLYMIIDTHEIQMRVKKMGSIVYCVSALLTYWQIVLNETDIRNCIDHMETDWKEVKHREDRQIMLECAHIGRRIMVISMSCGIAGAVLFRAIVPFTMPKIVVGNLSYRELPYPITKLIIDGRQSPANEILILVQCFCGIVMSIIMAGSSSMIALCALHARGQLKIIMCWLRYLVNGRPDANDTVDNRLSDIVKKHVRVLNFIACTEDIMHGVSFAEVVASTINMCVLALFMIKGWNNLHAIKMFSYVTLLLYFLFNIFIICYIGELLTEEYQKMADATYMIDWYEIEGKKALSLILIYSMTLSTTRLTAGKFIELSISSFGDIVRTSVAYLNMLRTVTS